MTKKITIPLIGVVAYSLAIVGLSVGVVIAVLAIQDDDAAPSSVGETDERPSGEQMSMAEAVLAGQQYMYGYGAQNPASDEHAALTEGYSPSCEAVEFTELGWLVRCGLRHADGREFERLFDLVVLPDGMVSANAGGS